MSTGGPSLEAYARALERTLSRLADEPVVVSARDFALVSDWHERGVPLALIEEALEHRAARRGGRRLGPGSVSAAVEESWRVLRAGRIDVRGPRAAPLSEALAAWEAVRFAEPPGSPLAERLGGWLDRARAGEAPAAIDAELDRELPDLCDAPSRLEGRRRAEQALAPYRERMTPDAFRATLRRALVDRLRRSRGLGRLALCDPSR